MVKNSHDLVDGVSSTLSQHPDKFGGHRGCSRPDIKFVFSHVTAWSKGHVACWTESPIGNYHSAKFGGRNCCGS